MRKALSKEEVDAEVDEAMARPSNHWSHWENVREIRKCVSMYCGYERKVVVTYTRQPDGSLGEPRWNKLCTACKHLLNAKHYDKEAEKNRRQAREIIAKREERFQDKIR